MLKRNLPILIADDEKAILLRHKAILAKYFSNILCAEDGMQAWEIFQPIKNIPLVVADIDMPNKDGIWLINQIRKVNLATQIIIISTLTKNSVAIFSTYSNIAYLPKPVDEMHLRLAASKAYDIYPEAVWVQQLREKLCEDKPDKDTLDEVLQNDPWRWHSKIVPSPEPQDAVVESGQTSEEPEENGPKAEIFFSQEEAQDQIAQARESLGEDSFNVFMEELDEILSSAEKGLLNLENNPQNPELIAAIFRDFHTVKGNCGMMGLHGIKEVTHCLEDVFSKIRSGELKATSEVIDIALKGNDLVQRVLKNEVGDDLEEIQLSLQAQIKKYL